MHTYLYLLSLPSLAPPSFICSLVHRFPALHEWHSELLYRVPEASVLACDSLEIVGKRVILAPTLSTLLAVQTQVFQHAHKLTREIFLAILLALVVRLIIESYIEFTVILRIIAPIQATPLCIVVKVVYTLQESSNRYRAFHLLSLSTNGWHNDILVPIL